MKREVFFIVARDGAVLWSDAAAGPALLPDSHARWEAIWRHRTAIGELAHSHPLGSDTFSREDETTMEALDRALGARLRYSVVSPGAMVARAGSDGADERVDPEPWWAALLRLASGM